MALLKPGKDPSVAKSFRPISPLCHTYKLFEQRFFVVLNGKKSRWRRQRNGLPQGSVLAPMLFNIYTNDQPIHADTRSFIYADDLCIASQGNDFNNIEASLTSALSTMTTYYDTNQLRAKPSKAQVCAFNLRNREAKRKLYVEWNGIRLSNTTTPVYLGIHLDRTLCYKTHIEKTKMKVNARNNIIRKLANSKLGCNASTLRPSCLALCYSAAEYACPVWARSTHALKLNPALHDCCRIISGCPKPTNLDSVHILAGIAPPHIRRTVACRMERTRQTTDARHQLFHHQPAASILKSRKSFMRTVTPLDSSASSSSLRLWKDSLTDVHPSKWDWRWPSLCRLDLERIGSSAHRGGLCENGDEEMGLSRRRPVGGLRLRGATDDGPPPLLPST